MVKITARTILGVLIALILMVVLFSMLPSILPTTITAVNDLYNTTNLGSSTLVGSSPAAFAAKVPTFVGWFWVVGPFVLVIYSVISLFLRSRR